MKLAEHPAALLWAEFTVRVPSGQKNDPIQHRKDFKTVVDAARYAVDNLQNYKNAMIEVEGVPALYWDTWRVFCETEA